jgi:hypothetical protein
MGHAFDSESCTLTPNALCTINAKLIVSPKAHSGCRHLRVLRASRSSSALKFFLRDAATADYGSIDGLQCRTRGWPRWTAAGANTFLASDLIAGT